MKRLVMLVVGIVAMGLVGCSGSSCENACNGSPAATCVASCNDTLDRAADLGCHDQAVAALDCLVNRPLDEAQSYACEYTDEEALSYRACLSTYEREARERCTAERQAWQVCAPDSGGSACSPDAGRSAHYDCVECYGYDHPDCN